MTPRQNDVYNFIIDYMSENIISPTVREICEGVGLKSTSSVYFHLKRLEQQGLITMRESEPRTIRPIGYKLVKIAEKENENG